MRNKILLLTFLATIGVIVAYFWVAKDNGQNGQPDNAINYRALEQTDKNAPVSPKDVVKQTPKDTLKPQESLLIPKHILAFQKAFYSQNREELYKQAESIKKLGKDAITQLLDIVVDKQHDVLFRKMAFELVRDIGLSIAEADLLIDIINDKTDDQLIRGEAAWALGLTGSTEAVDPLIAILSNKEEDSRIRKLSATSLGLINDARAEDVLIQSVNNIDNDNKVRAASAEALGYIHSPKALHTLLGSLNDQSWEVQIASSKGLSKFEDDKAVQALNSQLLRYVQRNRTDISDAVVRSIIDSLSSMKASESVPVLISIVKGEDQYYSALAGKTLGEIGDRSALLPTEEALRNATDPFQIRLLTEARRKLSEE